MARFLCGGACRPLAQRGRSCANADDARPKKMSGLSEARLPTAQWPPVSPERKTRHIPFPGQLLLGYNNHCRWLCPRSQIFASIADGEASVVEFFNRPLWREATRGGGHEGN